ncbi:STAS domain-containing protein [Amycolatopsis sp. NPDC003731]
MAQPRNHATPSVRTRREAYLPIRIPRELWVCVYQVRRDVTVLEVGGEVDVCGLADLRSAFAGLLGTGNRLVVLDFGRVGFFSAGGVGVLEHARRTLQDAGIPLRLAHPSRAVLRPLTALGLVGRFDIHAGVGRAVTAPAGG